MNPGARSVLAVSAVVALGLAAGPATARDQLEPSPAAVSAFCSIPPQEFFVRRIGGELVDVEVLVGPGQSPHTFEPTPRQMAHLAASDIYFAIGMPFEKRLLGRVEELGRGIRLVDTSEGIERRRVETSHEECEHAGHDDPAHRADPHDDGHGGLDDPHTWLNPRLARTQARNICGALTRLVPGSADIFEANLAKLLDDLDSLDAELAEALAPLAGESIYVFHPAFGYFTDAYGLRQVSVELGGMEPSARELAELMDRATAEGVRVIFVQPQFSARSALAIADEIGGAVVPIDPLSADYLDNMRAIAREVTRALGK